MSTLDERLVRLLDQFPDIVIVLDQEGCVLWGNETAENLFGQTLDEAIGRSAVEFVHPDDLEIVLRSFETIQSKSVGNPIEIRVNISGQWRLIETIGQPVNWFHEGAVLYSLRDLTNRRRFEVARDDVAQFRSLVHNSTTIMLLVSPTGLIESVSGALTRLLGHDPEVVEGQHLIHIVAPEDHEAIMSALAAAREGATASNPIVVGVHLRDRRDEQRVDYELSIVNLLDDPTVHGLVVTASDVSARVTAQQRLQGALSELEETLSLLEATLESTADGLLVVTNDRTIASYNSQLARMWRLPDWLLVQGDGLRALEFAAQQLVDPTSFLAKVNELYDKPEAEGNDVIEFKDGRIYERASKPQYVNGTIVGRVWSFSDITEQKRLESDLEHLAFHDTLTGLANRALFKDHLDQAIARSERTGNAFAVLFLDLDNFKTVNDSLGHSAGDQLLCSVAEGLSGCLRRSDTAARLGGDEFAVLIEDVESHDQVIALAERIMTALRRPVMVGAQKMSTSASVGITFGITESTSEQLLRNADLAMYLAKSQGKDRYEEFQDQMHAAVVARLELESDLRKAVVNEEFVVHYQPIVNVYSGEVVGVESLVRWQHPANGLLAPAEFIPFAEEIGLIDEIDDFVLRTSCRQVRQWQDDGVANLDFLVSVNLSAREIIDPDVHLRVATALGDSGLDARNLILEITESAVMRDVDAAVRNLHLLKGLGVSIAIDDFGTGYSSFSHLELMPIDILKVDRSFVANVARDDLQPNLSSAIVQLAQTLGLATIAEGVEFADQADRLAQIGCTLAQGYHLGRPIDAMGTESLLRAQTQIQSWTRTS